MKARVSLGLATPMFLVFLVLKLIGVIQWSWIWVTAPLWIPPIALLGVFFLAITVSILFGKKKKR